MEKIGRYQLLRKLGRGGMGSVYKALDPELEQIVAIKILHPFAALVDLLGGARLREIFAFEAATMAGLDHPAVVKILASGEDEQGTPFLVMEFFCNNLGKMIGEDFKVERRSRLIQPDKVLDYGHQLLEGLIFLDRRRVVHRDIKPYNILISDDDTVKICDFGMALVRNGSFTGPEALQVGSPFYAAPEQHQHPKLVDGRADLYSAGVLLYRMLTGELPSMRGFSLSLVNPLFDGAWDDFFARALSLQPASRFRDGEQMLEELQHLRLHWDKRQACEKGGTIASQPPPLAGLRKEPVNVCSNKAPKVFGLNEYFRPEITFSNHFVAAGEGAVRDLATGLVWQKSGSAEAMTWPAGQAYIAALNGGRFGGRDDWRLPTTNELFSLFDETDLKPQPSSEAPRSKWFWSCDIHGKRDVWYVNLEMGYTDWQDMSCRNFIRAVA